MTTRERPHPGMTQKDLPLSLRMKKGAPIQLFEELQMAFEGEGILVGPEEDINERDISLGEKARPTFALEERAGHRTGEIMEIDLMFFNGKLAKEDPAVRLHQKALKIADAITPFQRKEHPRNRHEKVERCANILLETFDTKLLSRLHYRLSRLSPYDQLRLEEMSSTGCHWTMRLQFIAADKEPSVRAKNPDTREHEVDDKWADRPSRDDVYEFAQNRACNQQRYNRLQMAVRVAAPTMFVATMGIVLPLAVISGLVPTGTLDAGVLKVFDVMIGPSLQFLHQETGGWVSKIAVAASAFYGWEKAYRVHGNLKETMVATETYLLDNEFGPENHLEGLNRHLRAIPETERCLLAHLSPIELRAFLLGNDEIRQDIMELSPPPLLAEIKVILAARPPGLKNYWRTSCDIGNLCLPSSWRTGRFYMKQFDMEDRIKRWNIEEYKETVQKKHLPRPTPNDFARAIINKGQQEDAGPNPNPRPADSALFFQKARSASPK